MTSISAAQLLERIRSNSPVEILDVRTPAEFQEVHLEAARNEPLERLDPAAVIAARKLQDGDPLFVICQSGGRSRQAYERFVKAGYENVVNVDGGTAACIAAGVPVVRGKKTISLERQVRITAGSLVFIGSILTWLVNPVFLVIPAFIGAGLVFAGITDTCGMGMVLARMPWNQCRT
ncbi:MAG TPA: rhodanese-like domain-containing protein [Planctomicrobium sp.]|nr:rhodanese-like domain-containing protein [Planctomicrobium sp.]